MTFTEDQQAIEDEGIIIPMKSNMPHASMNNPYNRSQGNFYHQQAPPAFGRNLPMYSTTVTNAPIAMMNYFNNPTQSPIMMEQDHTFNHQQQLKQQLPIEAVGSLRHQMEMTFSQRHMLQDITQVKLSKLGCEDFITLLNQVTELKNAIEKLSPILRENAITGRVLLYCELNELKSVLQLNFGNWEIFKLLILSLRDIEMTAKPIPTVKTDNRDINDGATSSQQSSMTRMKKSVIEKQVSVTSDLINSKH